ncbi:MAG: hypothetical protein ACLQDY_27420 [Streptosporangiaceae bacterium]
MIRFAARVLLAAFLAFATGALFIDWLGTSWWSRLNAALMAASIYSLFFIRRSTVTEEGSDGEAVA